MTQRLTNFIVRGLIEVIVKLADGHEHPRNLDAEDLVRFATQLVHCFGRRNRDGDDDARSLLLTDGTDRGQHGIAGRQAIIDQDDCLACQVEWRPVPAVGLLPPTELIPLSGNRSVKLGLGYSKRLDSFVVQDDEIAWRDRAYSKLRLTRCADLPDGEDVQRKHKRARHGRRHRHTSARKREQKRLRLMAVAGELLRKDLARVLAIAKHEH